MAGGCGERERGREENTRERKREEEESGRKERLFIPVWEFIHHWNQCVL